MYYPFDFEGRTYVRVGLKRYFYNKYFAIITLKSHWAKAEAVEFGNWYSIMKKVFYIICFLLITSCDKDNVNDCFQTSGAIIQKEFVVSAFTKILVNKDVELILKEGVTQKVVVETGKNLLNDVEVLVAENKLILTDNNSCNYVRDYGVTKVYVTAPNITEIRSSTQFDIRSDGVLTYPDLTVFSENFFEPDTYTVGDFRLQIDNNSFSLTFNNISNCYVSGKNK